MRKLLLASAAILGGASGAWAQAEPTPFFQSQGMMAMKWGGGPAANNNNNSVGTAVKGAIAVPAPGTVVIRLNGRVQADITAGWDTGDQAGGGKVQPVAISSWMRLYPGIDGMATNGLRYGASIELRENFPGSAAQPTPSLTGAAPSASTYLSGQTVFVRRAFAYLGNDKVGIVRLGQADGVIGLFDNGEFTSQGWDGGIGNFNGGTAQFNGSNNGSAIPFAWLAQAGAEYGNEKIVYLTPQFAGFDFGLQYAPSMGNGNSNCGAITAANSGVCNNISAGNDSTRWLNQLAVGARYQGTFGGFTVKGMAVYETAGKEAIAGGGIVLNGLNNTAATSASAIKYDNLSFVSAAALVTYNPAGVTLAFAYTGGALNGQLAMRPTGGVSENAFLVGAIYKNGPIVLGIESGWVQSQGAVQLTKITQRNEWEIAFGGTYNVAPGLALVGEFIHTQRHQGGVNFSTGATSAALGSGTRDGQANKLLFSTVVSW